MSSQRTSSIDIRKLTYLAIFTALVVVLQCIPIRFGTFELALSVPVMIIGAAICGVVAGGWLGLVFGVVVLFLPGTAAYLSFSPFGTVITVILKGVLAGFFSALSYKALERINIYIAALVAAFVATITNTGVFLIGSLLFFEADIATVIGVFISINFIIELIVNLVLVPVVVRVINIKKRV